MKSWMTSAAMLAALCGAQGLRAEPELSEELKAKLEKKLESPFLKKAAWHTEIEKAKAEAAKTGKPIFAYFTRSYAP